MKVYVLCGGKGTRLGEQIKCLTDIHGKPFMDYKIQQLQDCGATDIRLIVGPYSQEFSHYGLPMITDDQTGIANVLRYILDNNWWTMGDVLLDYPLHEADEPRMVVTRNTTVPNIAGIYLDCGLYYGKRDFTMVETDQSPLTINTPEDLELTRYALMG